MRRNPDLIFRILEFVEQRHDVGEILIPESEFEGCSGAEVLHNFYLCVDEGYLIARNDHGRREMVTVGRLTAAGHDALDDFRKERERTLLGFRPDRSGT